MRCAFLATFILLFPSLSACKPKPDASDPEQVAEAQSSSDLESADGLRGDVACDCSTLLPISFRPDFPKVSQREGNGCRYFGTGRNTPVLNVAVDAFRRSDTFLNTASSLKSRFVKIHDSTQKQVEGSGTAMVGVASDAQGFTRFVVIGMSDVGRVVTATEPLLGSRTDAPAPGFPQYVRGLAQGVAQSCGEP